jgi:hypothetical protein
MHSIVVCSLVGHGLATMQRLLDVCWNEALYTGKVHTDSDKTALRINMLFAQGGLRSVSELLGWLTSNRAQEGNERKSRGRLRPVSLRAEAYALIDVDRQPSA